MAIVFVSPRQRQKMFLTAIIAVFLLIFVIIALSIFLSKPKEVQPTQLVFNKPKVNVDFKVLDSEQFKSLEPFIQMQNQYNYKATTKKGRQIEGKVFATSIEEAQNILTGLNLNVVSVEEIKAGRENPFTPYYQAPPVPASVIKKTK